MQALDSPIEWSRDTFLREIAMRDAVKVIMQAISLQNPMMEWPALDEHCDFTGPGGKAIPADHYIGREGTVAFYARLGLRDAFAVCAVGAVLERRPGYAGQIGWGFSLADMARLGLTNTVYLGYGAYEDSARFRKYLVPISADECWAMLK
jgi:hypothetical protein